MKATFVELRTRSNEILQALERNEIVTILYRGVPKALMKPIDGERGTTGRAADHHAFGLWKDREDLQDASAVVRTIRQGRFHDL